MPDLAIPQAPPMGDTPGAGQPPGASPSPGGAPPSGDSTPVTPPTGSPQSPQSVPPVGQLAKGRSLMGIAMLFMDQAVRVLPAGTDDHHIAMELYMKAMKHFKKQEPIEPGPAGLNRPSMPQMPGAPDQGGAPGGAPPPGGMGAPMLPRGPIPAPVGGGGM